MLILVYVEGTCTDSPIRNNWESGDQRQLAQQEADVSQAQMQLQWLQLQQKATCNVSGQADNNVVNGEDFEQEIAPYWLFQLIPM